MGSIDYNCHVRCPLRFSRQYCRRCRDASFYLQPKFWPKFSEIKICRRAVTIPAGSLVTALSNQTEIRRVAGNVIRQADYPAARQPKRSYGRHLTWTCDRL